MNRVRYAECPDCHATGVYKGTMEPENVGIVCVLCSGSGKVQSSRLPLFSTRKRREDISIVFSSASDKRSIYVGKGISYEDFFKGSMPDSEGTTVVETKKSKKEP